MIYLPFLYVIAGSAVKGRQKYDQPKKLVLGMVRRWVGFGYVAEYHHHHHRYHQKHQQHARSISSQTSAAPV
jgi:hypothetical protein